MAQADRAVNLAVRAQGRCEYCHSRPRPGELFTEDHLIPRSDGGSDEFMNLAYVCNSCNTKRGAVTSYPDPWTRREVPLFNPRLDDWDDHLFLSPHGLLRGATAKGRATAALLTRSTSSSAPRSSTFTRDWGPLTLLTASESLVTPTSLVMEALFANNFSHAQGVWAQVQATGTAIRGDDIWFDQFMTDFINGVLLLKAGEARLGKDADAFIASLLKRYRSSPPEISQFSRDVAVAWLTKKALRFELAGETRRMMSTYVDVAALSHGLATERTWSKYGARAFRAQRMTALAPLTTSQLPDHLLSTAVVEARQQDDYQGLLDLLDGVLIRTSDERLKAELEMEVRDALTLSGYQQNGDIAQSICVRRRVILLDTLAEASIDRHLLKSELEAWKSQDLATECTELLASARRAYQSTPTSHLWSLIDLLREVLGEDRHPTTPHSAGDREIHAQEM